YRRRENVRALVNGAHSGIRLGKCRRPMPDPIVYPSWQLTAAPQLPARSYFYHLPPLAVGSAHVESLTSYLTRLAEAHDVTPGILLSRELIPRVREAFRRHA